MTFVAYPNISVRSRNSVFRLEVTGTPAHDFFRDQSSFVYRLYRRDRLVWESPGRKKEGGMAFLDDYPHEAWVSDEGWVVVRAHEWFHAGLLVFSPDGRIVLRRLHRRLDEDDPPGFLDTEPSEYMGDSSAGPFWARSAIAYFTDSGGCPLWVIRTWWGRRVVVDLTHAAFLSPSALSEDLSRIIEIGWIDNALEAGLEELEKEQERPQAAADDRRDWSIVRPVMTAAYHAGWLQAESSVPYLRQMEALRPSHHSVGYGPIGWAALITLPLRQVAKLSLLRLGREPTWLPHYGFQPSEEVLVNDSMFAVPAESQVRDAGLLKRNLNQKETLQQIGAPDFIRRHEWEYDLCTSGRSYTARIHWDDSHLKDLPHARYKVMVNENPPKIAQVEILEPQWRQITMRDHDVI